MTMLTTQDRLAQIVSTIQAIRRGLIWRIGEQLSEAQEMFRYDRNEGGFTGWLEATFDFGSSTAYRMIGVYQAFADADVSQIEKLSDAVLTRLAEPTVSPAARQEALARVDRGEEVTSEVVDDLKTKLRDAESGARQSSETVKQLTSQVRKLAKSLEEASHPKTFVIAPTDDTLVELGIAVFRQFPMTARERIFAAFATPFAAPIIEHVRETATEEPHGVTTRHTFTQTSPSGAGELSDGVDPASATEPEIPLSMIRDPVLRERERQMREAA